MKEFKHITLLCGHYGSGKTNVAVNMAHALKKQYDNAAIADLDIVNPYFRTRDSESELLSSGIRVICSKYAGTNLDAPALPAEMYAITEDASMKTVVDVGGDDRGATALGRLSDAIVSSGDYEMLMVVNFYRPLTPDAEAALEVMREIEAACRIPFTGIVNNSNIGIATRASDVLDTVSEVRELEHLAKIPTVMTSAVSSLCDELSGKIENLFPLTLQKNIV